MSLTILSLGSALIMLTTVVAAASRMRVQQSRRHQELLARALRTTLASS